MTNQKHNPSKHNPSPKVKSTPGPWEIVSYTSARVKGAEAIRGFTGYVVSPEIGVCGETLEQADANARLIAAAPELLQNLKQVVACLEYAVNVLEAPEKSSIREDLALAKQAIAKAEGE